MTPVSIAADLNPRVPSGLSDDEVVRRVLSGERQLFEILMRRHNRLLFRATRSILDNDVEAEDVMQEAYVRAYTHLASFEGRSAFSTWLTHIAVHEALVRKKRRGRVVVMDPEMLPERDSAFHSGNRRSPEQLAMDTELRQYLESAIDRLPLNYRTVFMLRDVQGLNTAETAACLSITEQAVKTRLHRARMMLREDLSRRVGLNAEKVFEFLGERCDRIVAEVLARIEHETPLDGPFEIDDPEIFETLSETPE